MHPITELPLSALALHCHVPTSKATRKQTCVRAFKSRRHFSSAPDKDILKASHTLGDLPKLLTGGFIESLLRDACRLRMSACFAKAIGPIVAA